MGNPAIVTHVGSAPIGLGDCAADGAQLRPHIVWFGEDVMGMEEAKAHILEAGRFLVVGTSLSVFPAAGLVNHARYNAEKIIVDPEPTNIPFGFRAIRGSADKVLPPLGGSLMTTASPPHFRIQRCTSLKPAHPGGGGQDISRPEFREHNLPAYLKALYDATRKEYARRHTKKSESLSIGADAGCDG